MESGLASKLTRLPTRRDRSGRGIGTAQRRRGRRDGMGFGQDERDELDGVERFALSGATPVPGRRVRCSGFELLSGCVSCHRVMNIVFNPGLSRTCFAAKSTERRAATGIEKSHRLTQTDTDMGKSSRKCVILPDCSAEQKLKWRDLKAEIGGKTTGPLTTGQGGGLPADGRIRLRRAFLLPLGLPPSQGLRRTGRRTWRRDKD
jgi:hypothetical protein